MKFHFLLQSKTLSSLSFLSILGSLLSNSFCYCDLKPSNVLNDEMVEHVSDFGLARFLHDIIQDSSTNQLRSIEVRGTIGYTPPSKFILHFLNLIAFLFPYFLLYF